ncbi:MAG TPA: hypothetical protein VD837_14415 [Terriglobales bacterium]|nr:hypothetical protein [Terriglobales bacterium]
MAGEDERESIENEQQDNGRDPRGMPWFKFWASRWLGSDTVDSMSLAQQGIYVRLLCGLQVYGKLTRDVWKLSKRLNIPYRPLMGWMTDFGGECEILHDGNCCFPGAQALPFDSEKAVPKQYADSTEAPPRQCPCTSWTVPNFEKLQVLLKKSSADAAGEENRRDKRREDFISSAADAAANTKTKPAARKGKGKYSHDETVEWCDLYTNGDGTCWRPKIGRLDCDYCNGKGVLPDGSVRDRIKLDPCSECFPDDLEKWKRLVAEKWPDMPKALYE